MKYKLINGSAYYNKEGNKYVFVKDKDYRNDLNKYHKIKNFEESTDYYFRTFAKLREKSYNQAIKKLKAFHNTKTLRVLDVGCLYGIFLNQIKLEGWYGYGIEPSIEEAQYAQKNFKLNVATKTFEEFNSEEKWDVITFWDVIEHLPNLKEVLKKVKSLLTDRGILIIRIPNGNGLLHKISFLIYHLSLGKVSLPVRKLFENHLFIYSESAIRNELVKESFRILTFYKEEMIDVDIKIILNKSYLEKLPQIFKISLAYSLKTILWLSKVFNMGDSMIIFAELDS